jgi:hypothetical protein
MAHWLRTKWVKPTFRFTSYLYHVLYRLINTLVLYFYGLKFNSYVCRQKRLQTSYYQIPY